MSGVGFFKRLFGHEQRAAEPAPDMALHARPGSRFLIIDDSPTIVAVLSRMLQHGGFQTITAYSAERGIDLAETELPHLIFLDIVLPGMSGFEALRHLRRSEMTRNIPIIMISGNEQATEQFYLQRIGADDFMKKPFTRADVFARIGHLLGPDQLPHRHMVMPVGGVARRMSVAG